MGKITHPSISIFNVGSKKLCFISIALIFTEIAENFDCGFWPTIDHSSEPPTIGEDAETSNLRVGTTHN
jgi:hypothetical protein